MIIEGARDTDKMSWMVQETPWTKHGRNIVSNV